MAPKQATVTTTFSGGTLSIYIECFARMAGDPEAARIRVVVAELPGRTGCAAGSAADATEAGSAIASRWRGQAAALGPGGQKQRTVAYEEVAEIPASAGV